MVDFTLNINGENGKDIYFKDATVNADYSLIKAIRLQLGNYLAIQNISEATTLKAFNKYLKTFGIPRVYDGIEISTGDFFIPQTDLDIIGNDKFETTGYYVPNTTFLPTATNTLVLSTSDWGIDSTVFPDTIYPCQYETYIDTTPSTLSNTTEGKTYIVVGSGTAVNNSNTYTTGEVFTASTNGAVTFTGSANLKILQSSRHKFYVFTWGLSSRYYSTFFEDYIANGFNPLANELGAELKALEWANLTQRISMSKCQETIQYINDKIIQSQ